MKVVIYERKPVDKYRNESIEEQKKKCYNYCKERDLEVVKEYCDDTNMRKEYKRMLKRCQSGKIQGIVVSNFDILAYGPIEPIVCKTYLKQYDVKIMTVDGKLDNN